jgi:hypothetical protein
MASSAATSVEQYLAELPDERRDVVSRVREVVRKNLPTGYREGMGFGMICYTVPLERYPNTYNKQPLGYVALAAQKNYYALYLTMVYQSSPDAEWLKAQFARAGKKLDMGKSCLRFRSLEDLPLDAIGELVRRTPPDAFIAQYEAARAGAGVTERPAKKATAKQAGSAKKATAKKPTAKKSVKRATKRAR